MAHTKTLTDPYPSLTWTLNSDVRATTMEGKRQQDAVLAVQGGGMTMIEELSGGQAWLFASNPRTFDVEKEFAATDEILWSETTNAHVLLGDTVFLYATKPTQAITHQCVVVDIGLPPDSAEDAADSWIDDEALEDRKDRTWMALRLVRTLSADERQRLNLAALQTAGLNGGILGRRRAAGGVLSLLRDVLLDPSPSSESDPTAEDFPTDGKLIEAFEARIDEGHYAVSDFETYVPDRYASQKTRGSAQKAFADRVKSNYGYKCAITGISTPYFLVASHIVPWSEDASIRLDPGNGLCLSTMVDRAFEDGYLQIDPEGSVHINQGRLSDDPVLAEQLKAYDGMTLAFPSECPPRPDLLERRWNSTAG
jgi:putative restriction endonuclease